MTIVGVTRRGFSGLQVGTSADVVVPMMMKAQMTPTWNDLDNRRSRWVTVIGRLQARACPRRRPQSQMNVIYRQVNEQEIKDIKNASETFRQRFVTKHLDVAARRARAVRSAPAVLDAADRADVRWSASCC